MDLPISALVDTTDGACGRLTNIVLDPSRKMVTHLVVAAKDFPHTEHLVPIDLVLDGTPHAVRLRCACQELAGLSAFIETEYFQEEIPYEEAYFGPFLNQPWEIPLPILVPLEHRQIPPGELAVDRRVRVEATDGYVGRVDDLVVDPTNSRVTHLVLRKGHLWGQRDVTVPVEEIARFADDTVYLRLDKRQVRELPAVRPHTEAV